MIASIWNRYLNVLNNYPTITQMIQTSILMGSGDVIAQNVFEKDKNFDKNRTLKFMGLGFFYVAPTIRVWYMALERIVPSTRGGSALSISLRKVALDQLTFAPIMTVGFISLIGAMQKKHSNEIIQKVKKEWPDVMMANYKLWPWVQIVNFTYVDPLVRPLVVSIVALAWNTYLSWKTQSNEDTNKID